MAEGEHVDPALHPQDLDRLITDFAERVPGVLHAAFVASDATSPIARAEYSLDAGRWQFLEPVGKLSDSLTEHYELNVPLAAIPVRTPRDEPESAPPPVVDPQEHILTVRVYDRYDNVSAAKTVIH